MQGWGREARARGCQSRGAGHLHLEEVVMKEGRLGQCWGGEHLPKIGSEWMGPPEETQLRNPLTGPLGKCWRTEASPIVLATLCCSSPELGP